ncbi:hypothetical protein DSO57_1031239 [Entomophthora muscae]|uniref:Uncharacterized protein n=1 Tax=Entomophthora muscae TaxID=34485 RepID=A0ACC2T0S7_9FUNG|nr:hypothetical protein DSO57_1031239 [Entomophthora muscae]
MIVESGTHAELMKPLAHTANWWASRTSKTPLLSMCHPLTLKPGLIALSLWVLPWMMMRKPSPPDTEDIPADVEAPLFKSLWFIICQSMPKIDVLLVGISGASLLGLVNFIMVLMALKGASYMKDDTINLDDVVWNTSAAMILVSVCAGIFQLMSSLAWDWQPRSFHHGFGISCLTILSSRRLVGLIWMRTQWAGWWLSCPLALRALLAFMGRLWGHSSLPSSTQCHPVPSALCQLQGCPVHDAMLSLASCHQLHLHPSHLKFSRKSQKAYNHSTQLACESTSPYVQLPLTREDEVFKHYCASLKAPLRSELKNAYISTIVLPCLLL